MICLACHYANEEDARFCEQCGQSLNITCPSCGSPANAGARFCRHCGQPLLSSPSPAATAVATALPPPRPPSLDERLDQLQRYLPAHLADKILANRGRLAGERKLVTVLFADIAGYTALSAQVGEEALFALMDELYELLIHEVHRYEGTVNELTGDGLVAFFGAPLAVEQAPQRAVRAALALQQAVTHYSARVEHERGMRIQLRVGLNTGPVIVGTVGNNLRMDYKAIGNTVNLAARGGRGGGRRGGRGEGGRKLVLAIEDLHWADATSVEFLTFLLEHMAGSRILPVCTYRPDFASLWSGKSYHSVITLPPLVLSEGREMLTALLGTTPYPGGSDCPGAR